MKARFFNRFFVFSALALVFTVIISILEYKLESGIFRFVIYDPASYVGMVILFATSLAGTAAAVDEIGARQMKWIRIIFVLLFLLFIVSMLLNIKMLSLILFFVTLVTVMITTVLVVKGQRRLEVSLQKNGLTISAFYLLIVSYLSVVFAVIWYGIYDDILYDHEALLTLLIICIGATFVLSLLSFVATYYWKRVKMISLISLFCIMALLAVFYNEFSLIERAYSRSTVYDSDYWYEDKNVEDKVYETPTSSVVEEETFELSEEEEEIEEIEPFTLDFLWDNTQADEDSVRAGILYYKDWARSHYVITLPLEFFEEKKYTDNEITDEDWSVKGERASSIILSYLGGNRNSLDIRGIFKAYKHLLPSLISREEYDKLYRAEVDLLLVAYNDLDDKSDFMTIYRYMNQFDDERTRSNEVEYISQYMTSYGYYNFFIKHEFGKESVIYYYSFWGRRANEGNMEACAEILEEIRSMYTDGEEEY